MKKIYILSIAAMWSLTSNSLFSAALVLAFDSGGLLLQNSAGVALTGGGVATPFDGEVIQVGYFSGATSNDNNFSGTWIPITGEGSVNYVPNSPTGFDTTVGDDVNAGFDPNNQFAIRLEVDTNVHNALPAPGTILSIRVFDRSSIATRYILHDGFE